MTITLLWQGREYDLTDKFDIFSYNFQDSLDNSIDNAFISSMWLKGQQEELDFERGLPRYSILKIGEKHWYIGEYVVKEKSKRFKHDIPLLSLEKALQRKLLPAMALTQPTIDKIGEYIRSLNSVRADDRLDVKNDYYGKKMTGVERVEFHNNYTTPNSDLVNGLYLKKGQEYVITFNTTLMSDIHDYYSRVGYNVKLDLKFNGKVLRHDKVAMEYAVKKGSMWNMYYAPYISDLSYSITYTPEEDGYLALDSDVSGTYITGNNKFVDLNYHLVNTTLSISTNKVSDLTTYTLDYWVERLLKEAGGEYLLSDNAKAKLSQFRSNEQTIPAGFDLYTALNDVAETIGAMVKVKLENKGKYTLIDKQEWLASDTRDTLDMDKSVLLEYANFFELDRPIDTALRSREPEVATIDDYYFVEVPMADYDYEFQVDGEAIQVTQNNIFDIIDEKAPEILLDLDTFYKEQKVLKIESVPYGNQYWQLEKHKYSYIKLTDEELTKVVDFVFYDDLEIIQEEVDSYEKSITYDFDNYVNELELNADNIIDNSTKYYPFKNGKMGLRSLDKNSRMTDTNIGVDVGRGIYKIEKFIVSGLEIEDSNGDKYYEHDITRRVLDKRVYDTLPKNPPTYNKVSRMFINATQNSTIYYVDGDSRIYGMGSIGALEPDFWIEKKVNRALFEACAAEISEKYNVDIKTKDKGQVIDDDIRIYIEYKSYNETRMSVLKEDQSGFNIKSAKHFNDIAKLNDANTIGNLAERKINRMGNNVISVSGYIDNIEELTPLGSITDEGYKVVSRNVSTSNKRYYYTIEYVKDFISVNRNIGVDSPIKLYDVPMENIVIKRDKVNNVISFDLTNNNSYLTDLKEHININGKPVKSTFATIDFDNTRIGASVNDVRLKNVITWNIKMDDNYSAGLRQVDKVIQGQDTAWSEEVRYTDSIGRVEMATINFYEQPNFLREEYYKSYPLVYHVDGDIKSNITYLLLKDAREVFAHTHQITFLGSNDVNVYNMATDSTNIGMADFKYIPSKQAVKIDLSKVDIIENNAIVNDNNIEPNADIKGLGYGFYDKDTLDLILFVKGNSKAYFGAYTYGKPLIEELEDDNLIRINEVLISTMDININGLKLDKVEFETRVVGHTSGGSDSKGVYGVIVSGIQFYTLGEKVGNVSFDTKVVSVASDSKNIAMAKGVVETKFEHRVKGSKIVLNKFNSNVIGAIGTSLNLMANAFGSLNTIINTKVKGGSKINNANFKTNIISSVRTDVSYFGAGFGVIETKKDIVVKNGEVLNEIRSNTATTGNAIGDYEIPRTENPSIVDWDCRMNNGNLEVYLVAKNNDDKTAVIDINGVKKTLYSGQTDVWLFDDFQGWETRFYVELFALASGKEPSYYVVDILDVSGCKI